MPATSTLAWQAATASQDWPLVSGCELGSLPRAVPRARLHTKLVLGQWELHHVIDSAEMVVSELVTNAVKASWPLDDSPPVILCLLANHDQLIIQVWDAVASPPAQRAHAIDAEGGRGLEIVSLLSDRWDFYHPDAGGKIVWAALSIATARTAT